jgi:hypothetical protein
MPGRGLTAGLAAAAGGALTALAVTTGAGAGALRCMVPRSSTGAALPGGRVLQALTHAKAIKAAIPCAKRGASETVEFRGVIKFPYRSKRASGDA